MKKISSYLLIIFIWGCSNEKPINTDNKKIEKAPVIPDTAAKTEVIKQDTSAIEKYLLSYGLVNIHSLDTSIRTKIIYSDTCNFLHQRIYDSLYHAYFPCDIAIKICNAQFFLKHTNPDLSLIVFDAARPHSKQKFMWDSLKMEPNIKYNYVSTPWDISLHNYGAAVDISIIDTRNSSLLDMGTPVDHFGKLSEPIYEWHFLKNKELSDTAFKNRKLLRNVMGRAGFYPITSEWWHFNSCNKLYAESHYQLIK